MTHTSAADAKARNIVAMGQALGEQYSELWQHLASLNYKWREYVCLFGTKSDRIKLLNRAAPGFARLIQDELWDSVLLGIARITDPSRTGKRSNLTVLGLSEIINDPPLRVVVEPLVADAQRATEFCRDWRNRRLAHSDLESALGRSATPLTGASRAEVKHGLGALAAVLNAVQLHYFHSETHYSFSSGEEALKLLYVIDDGLRTREARLQRLQDGIYTSDDLERREL